MIWSFHISEAFNDYFFWLMIRFIQILNTLQVYLFSRVDFYFKTSDSDENVIIIIITSHDSGVIQCLSPQMHGHYHLLLRPQCSVHPTDGGGGSIWRASSNDPLLSCSAFACFRLPGRYTFAPCPLSRLY